MAQRPPTPSPAAAAAPAARPPLDLADATLGRTLWRLSGPAVLENLLFSFVLFADSLIVGWLRDEASLAATALAGVAMYFIQAPFFALSVAASALVARRWGERAFEEARRTAAMALALSAGLAVLILGPAWPAARSLVVLLGAAPDVAAPGTLYLRIVLLSALAGLPMIAMTGALRAIGNTRTPMLITLAMNVVNVAVSVALAFGLGPLPALGLAGVAWGTVVARVTGCALALRVMASPGSGVGLRWAHVRRPDLAATRSVLALAAPAMADRLLHTGAQVAFMRVVALLGTTALAAHNIALHVESLAFMPAIGISAAAATVVGQALGAGRPATAARAVRRALAACGLLMGALSLLFLVCGPLGARAFGATPEVVRVAGLTLRVAALELPFLGVAIVLSAALRGAGDTRSPLWVNLGCIAVFRLAAVYLAGVAWGGGLPGVWVATALDWAARAAGLWLVFRRGRWMRADSLSESG